MRGSVLQFDEVSGQGYISGDDGVRYTFRRNDISAITPPRYGLLVDFVPQGTAATEVFALPNQGPAAPAPGQPAYGQPEGGYGATAAPANYTVEPDLGLWGYFTRALTAKYADFSGRARRKEFWGYTLFMVLIQLAIAAVVFAIAAGTGVEIQDNGTFSPDDLQRLGPVVSIGVVVFVLFALAVLLPSLAVTVRRFHDIGQSGWIYVLLAVASIIPIVGFVASIAILVMLCLNSQRQANKFGPPPKQV